MPITLSYPDPYSVGTLSTAWAYCEQFSFNFGNKTGRFVYAIHADKTSAYSDKPPLKRVEINVYATAQNGLPSFDDLVAANQQAYGLLLPAVDNLALTRSEFAGGSIEVTS